MREPIAVCRFNNFEVLRRSGYVVDHASGGFCVSSKTVGDAIATIINHATMTDVVVLHGHLLNLYHRTRLELDALPEEDEDDGDGS
jgi:hypothetical protein